jgi:hypothetical protein
MDGTCGKHETQMKFIYVILVENTDVKNAWKNGSLQNRMGGCGTLYSYTMHRNS